MSNKQLINELIIDNSEALKIRNISLGTAFNEVKSLESLSGFATPFMSLHEDFSISPFDIRYRYHNQNNTVGKIVVDIAQSLNKEQSTAIIDNTFNELSSFYTNFYGAPSARNEESKYDQGIKQVWSADNVNIILEMGYEDGGDKLKVLKLSVSS